MTTTTKPRRKVYKTDAALAMAAKYGFTENSIRDDYLTENRLVTLHQNWLPSGPEIVEVRLARGKYRGNFIGSCTRPKEQTEKD